MIPRLRSTVLLLSVLAAWGVTTGVATAEPKDGAANRKISEAMTRHFRYDEFAQAESLLRGTYQACGDECSANVRARLWLNIGVVRGTGRGDQEGARQAFRIALEVDPRVELAGHYADDATQATYAEVRREIPKPEAPPPAPPTTPPAAAPTQPPPPPPVSASGGASAPVPADTAYVSPVNENQVMQQQPGAQQPGAQQPGAQQPGAQQPGARQSAPASAVSAPGHPPPGTTAGTPPADGVPVSFKARKAGNTFTVSDTASGQVCTTPCTMQLSPGKHKLQVSGASQYKVTLKVPPGGGSYLVKVFKKGQFYTGGVITAVSVIGLVGLTIATWDDGDERPDSVAEAEEDKEKAEGALIAVGILGAVGVTGLVLFATAVPNPAKDEGANSATRRPSGMRLRSAGVAPSRNGVFASATFSF